MYAWTEFTQYNSIYDWCGQLFAQFEIRAPTDCANSNLSKVSDFTVLFPKSFENLFCYVYISKFFSGMKS